MIAFADNFALKSLDRWRAQALRFTMGSLFLREIYLDRSRRLTVLSLAAMGLNFVLAALAPLWLLAFSPVFWGLPHLAASLRYTARVQSANGRSKNAICFLAGLSFFMIALRLWADFGTGSYLPWLFENRRLEFLGLFLAALGLGLSFRHSPDRIIRSFVFLLPVMCVGILFPRLSLGILLFGHHFLAFGVERKRDKIRKVFILNTSL